jgi:23S rRNA pseudouridine1911/1915/1917 synthase
MELTKIYEDNQILVLNKPVGIIVNRSNTAPYGTLQDLLDNSYSFAGDNTEFVSRSGLAHRIDKDTSGVLLVALTEDAFVKITAQFKSREVEKEYLALLHGSLPQPLLEINAPIARNPDKRFKFAVVSSGKPATTKVTRLNQLTRNEHTYTLAAVFPKTGRTHQIRVHMAALGNYIVNDPIYCTRKLFEQGEEVSERMMLHAHKISFRHPKSGKIVEYCAEKPHDFDF